MRINITQKRVLLLLFFICLPILLASCRSPFNIGEATPDATVSYQDQTIHLESIRDQEDGVYTGAIIPNAKAALNYAKVFLSDSQQLDISQWDKYEIIYDANQQIWMVSFWSTDTVGGNSHVILQKDTGEILMAWSGE